MADRGRNFQVIRGSRNRMTLKKLIIILGIVIVVFFSGQRFLKIYEQNQLIRQLELELANERVKNSQLLQEIEKLNSPEGIERIAREQLGLVKENEILIKPVTINKEEKDGGK